MDKKNILDDNNAGINPNRKYLVCSYSTFDAKLSRAAKEFAGKYNDAVNKNDKPNALAYKKAIQKLVGQKMLEKPDAIFEYIHTLRANIMNTILDSDLLMQFAIQFKKLTPEEKKSFMAVLDKNLSKKYDINHSDIFYMPNDNNSDALYAPTSENGGERSSIAVRKEIKTLEECMSVFSHEYSHKITFENPDASPLGAQAADLAHKFYIFNKEDHAGYTENADEALSYAVQTIVAKDFEKDFLASMAMREQAKQYNK